MNNGNEPQNTTQHCQNDANCYMSHFSMHQSIITNTVFIVQTL